MPKFLETLAALGIASSAAKIAGVSRKTVYEWKNRHAAFGQAWEEALDEGVDSLEQRAWERAARGTVVVKETTTTRTYLNAEGIEVSERTVTRAETTRYSDRMLLAVLAAHRPHKWRHNLRVETTGADGGPIEVKTADEIAESFNAHVLRLVTAEEAGEASPHGR